MADGLTVIEDKVYITILVKSPVGEEEFNALLDTGAYKTLIPETDCKNLKLEKIEEREVIGICQKPVMVYIYKADVFFLGNRVLGSVIGFDIPSREKVSLVGRDLITQFNLNLNYKGKKVEIIDP